ncbi:MAG: hypothetical protein F8N38_15465 [Hungatella sp.]|nr:hypothetical protein [Hungatella sp.]
MELDAFASEFPELYAMLNETVRITIVTNNMAGEESLRDWDNMIDNYVSNFDYEDCYGQETGEISSQQIPFGGRDGRDRNRRRRRFDDFNLRDITRLLFLRQLFDCDRC